MKKLTLTILLVLIFSLNLLSQIDFSSYPEISKDDLENCEYEVIYESEISNVKIVTIEGVMYIVFY